MSGFEGLDWARAENVAVMDTFGDITFVPSNADSRFELLKYSILVLVSQGSGAWYWFSHDPYLFEIREGVVVAEHSLFA